MSDELIDISDLAPDDPFAAIPERYNLGIGLTADNVARHGERVALHWADADGREARYTYAQLDETTNRLAGALQQIGVARGEHVALALPNIPAFYVGALAVAKLGGVSVPIPAGFSTQCMMDLSRETGALAILVTPHDVATARAAAHETDARHIIAVPYRDASPPADALDFDRLVDEGTATFDAAFTDSDEPAFIVHSAGTTGRPKRAVHAHRFPLAYDNAVCNWYDFQPDDVVTGPGEPSAWRNLAGAFLLPMRYGLSVFAFDDLGEAFPNRVWYDRMSAHGVTNLVGDPTILQSLVDDAALQLRHAVSTGSPVTPQLQHAVHHTIDLPVWDGLGMAECAVVCHNRPASPSPPGSCGRPSPAAVGVLDAQRRPVATGQTGWLALRQITHPGLAIGYWQNGKLAPLPTSDGWFFTGDRVALDDGGHLWHRGWGDPPTPSNR